MVKLLSVWFTTNALIQFINLTIRPTTNDQP